MSIGYTASVSGTYVNVIPQLSSGNNVIAQNLMNGISAINGGAQVLGNTLTPTSTLTTSGPVVMGIGQGSPAGVGYVNVGTLQPNVVAVLVNNTNRTSLATSQYAGNDTVVAGTGGLTMVDNGYFDTINVGGGSNYVTLNGVGATFGGDGTNFITLNYGNRGVASTVNGTTASTDTIKGNVGATGNLLYNDGGGTAWINPTAGNVTIMGGTGTETVFGGSAYLQGKGVVTANAFTGSLTVVNGTGYFAGGTAGNNIMSTSSVGGTTLVGGGSGDMLTSNGPNDRLVAGGGIETLNASNSSGGVALFGSSSGATLMYGSASAPDDFWIANSTVAGTGFVGAFVALHTAPNSPIDNLNTTVHNTVDLGGSGTLGMANASVYDFISGVDKVNVFNAGGATATLTYFTQSDFVALTTTTGAQVLFLNTNAIAQSDIAGINVVNTVTAHI